jgi:hypothetical protein
MGLTLFDFVGLMALSLFVFALPQNFDRVNQFSDSWDLFFKLIYGFGIDILNENYQLAGIIILVLAFLGLFSFFIIHGYFKNLYNFVLLYSVILIFIYPIGTVIGFLSLYLIYAIKKDEKEMAKLALTEGVEVEFHSSKPKMKDGSEDKEKGKKSSKNKDEKKGKIVIRKLGK